MGGTLARVGLGDTLILLLGILDHLPAELEQVPAHQAGITPAPGHSGGVVLAPASRRLLHQLAPAPAPEGGECTMWQPLAQLAP